MGKYDSKNQYNKIHYKQFNIRLDIDKDAAIIAFLDEQESLPDFIRKAVNNAKMAQKKALSRARKKALKNETN
jgi:hypothetical protein